MDKVNSMYAMSVVYTSKDLAQMQVIGMRRNSFVVTLCSLIAIATVMVYDYHADWIIPTILISSIALVSFAVGLRVNEKHLVLSQRIMSGLVVCVIVYLSLISNSISTTILFIPILTFVFFIEKKFELRMLYLSATFIALFLTFLRFWPEVGIAGASLSGLSSESLSDCILATIFTGIFIRSHSVFSRLTIEVAKAQALRLEDSLTKTKLTIRELEERREHLSTVRKKTSSALEGERAAAREIRASQEQLEQFAYAASHDLKEPIRTVRSFFQVIRRRANPEVLAKAEIAKYVSLVESKSSSMHNMLERLLLFSRLSSHQGVSKVQSLSDLIEESSALHPANPDISLCIDSGADEIYLDPNCARRVFSELLANAIAFASSDRSLTLNFKAEKKRKGYITCMLTDNGIGIDQAALSKVTGLFQRLSGNSTSDSSGLGLSIAKAIIEREGGELWLTSTVGEGTSVHFELPAL